MTNTKSTKRALVSSVMALFLCFAMLLGTTYAWFADSVTSNNNIIKSGTLNVEMYYADGSKAVPADDAPDWKNAQGVAIYTADQLWEPGYTDAKHIKISNEGTLALKYQLAIIPTGEVSQLAEVIDVYLYEIADTDANATQVATRADLNESMYIGTLADVISKGIVRGNLAADTDYTTTIVLKMQENADNDYQNLSIGDDFTIQLLATQYTAEGDNFGDDYDAEAVYADTYAATVEDLKAALADPAVESIALTEDIDLAALAAQTRAAGTNIPVISIPKGTTKVIDLNGRKITGTYSNTGNVEMFNVQGNLTVKNGTVEMGATVNQGWNAMSTIFDVTAGGVLNVKNATLVNLGGTDMSFCVHLNNWGKATLNVDDSTLIAPYCAIRVFNSGNDMNNVTVTDTTMIAKHAFWVHNYTTADFGTAEKAAAHEALLNVNFLVKDETGKIIGFSQDFNNEIKGNIILGFTDTVYLHTAPSTVATVESAEEILEFLIDNASNNENTLVILQGDVNMESAQTAPYGNKYGVALNGGVLDGNGNELYMECYGDDYGVMTTGGTIKNITIQEGCRAIMIMYPTTDIIVDNANIGGDGVLYPINTGEAGAEGVKLIVTNSTLAGWTSFGNIESASFTNVKFEQGTYYNNIYGRVLKPYVNTELRNCDFVEHMNLDLSSLTNGHKITMSNCTVAGQPITLDTFQIPATDADYDTMLFTVDLPGWASSIADCIIIE